MKNRLSDIFPLIVCSVLVSSISKIVFNALEIETQLGFIVMWSLIFVIALYLLMQNKKYGLIAISLIVLVALIIYLRLDDLGKEAVREYIINAFAFLRTKDLAKGFQVEILSAVLVFLISLIIIIPTLIFPIYPVTLAVSVLFILILWKKQQLTIITEVSMIIGSLIVLFAQSMKTETNNPVKRIRNLSAAWLVPFVILISIAIVSIAENNDLNKKWEWLAIRTNIIKDYIADITGNPSPRTIYDISGVGYQPLDNRLGGPVELDDTELFKYRSSTRSQLLLRGNIKNVYTGNNWVDEAVSYRSRMINKYINSQNKVFNLDIPDEEFKLNIYYERVKVLINPSTDLSATIFAPNRTLSVDPSKFLTMLVSFNTEGEVFSSRDISKGISYTLEVDHIKYNTDSFEDYVEHVQLNLSEEGKVLDELIDINYTSPFEEVPPSVINLAKEITTGIESDYQKAVAIKEFLEDGFIYTLSPVSPPIDSDFVEYFLQTKRGYCTYFASTMAVLARSAGLPSRYVEGFRIDPVSQNRIYPITGENAHAWAEVYIKGIGWIPFDPATTSEEEDSGPALITEDEDELEEDIVSETESVSDTESDEGSNFSVFYLILGILLFVALILLSIIVSIKVRTDLKFVKKRISSNNSLVTFYYTEIMLILSYLNYEKPIGHTLNVYSKGVDNRITLYEYLFKDVTLIVSKMLYAQVELSKEDVLYVNGYFRALYKYIIKNLGIFKYLYITTSLLIKKGLRNAEKPF